MRLLAIPFVSFLGLSACDPALLIGKADDVDAPEISCATRPAPGCNFDQSPLRVLPEPVELPRRAYKFFPTATRLSFVDSRNRVWVAPARTLTDGASIPPIFTAIVGDPTSPEFINAAAVHDAYCGVGNEQGDNFHNGRWQDVHIMFYDGLVAGGTEPLRAKLMFAAVWLGGPRWQTSRDLTHVPVTRKQQAMKRAKAFVETKTPTLPSLIEFLEILEREMLTEYPPERARTEDNYYEPISPGDTIQTTDPAI